MQKILRTVVFIVFSLWLTDLNAQVNESFSDGDFTSNPTWTGSSSADWMVNSATQLQSNNQVASGTFYLSTPNALATQTQWEFWVKMDFNPSSLNYIDAYLTASSGNLTAAATTGYFVRIGNTDDEISLYRKDANGNAVKIIDGIDDILNNSTNTIKIKVIRGAGNQWMLFRDLSGTGNSYVSEGTVTDATFTTSSFFGFSVRQSTASFFQKHFFDDIVVQPYIPDVTPPAIQTVTAPAINRVDVLFNEPVDVATSQTVSNYSVNNSIGSPSTAVRDASNSSLVHLTFATSFVNGATNTITISGVKDVAGNAINNATATFSFFVAPPVIQAVTATSANTVDVLFSKPVETPSSQTVSNYTVNNSVGNPASAVRDATNTALVHLTFANNFPNGVINTLTINGVKDLAGVEITNGTATFSFYVSQRFDVIIDEMMVDETPVVGLPEAEFIELKNVSGKPINLQGWKVTTSTSTSGLFGSYVLPADSFLIITRTSAVAAFAPYGRVLGVTSFPALPNDGSTVTLISKEGVTVHTVTYNSGWYKNALKSEGGWTLEMIDTKNPCAGIENWKASVDTRGGTPGAKNSVDAANPDNTAPALVRAAAIDNVTIVLTFNEPVDSSKAASVGNYSISNSINVLKAVVMSPSFTKVQLTLGTPLVSPTVYTVTANNITDCSGNAVQAAKTARVGLPSPIDSLGIIVNEILFNPPTNGVDYIEIYNRSDKIYDLKNLYLANRSSTTLIVGSIRQVSTENLLIFPGDYFVLTSTGDIVKQQFVTKNPDNFIDISSFPTYANDRGFVVLLNQAGSIIDEVDYLEKWHSPLTDNKKGVALERIDFNKNSNDPANWYSAASTVGYGTPGYQNSQFRADLGLQGEVTITPKVFSPDNDGFDDFAILNYQLTDPGYVANITIFDAAGRPVRVLARNATLAQTGSFRWDGFDDKLRRVPVGTYVIYTEVFNLAGKKKSFKNTVVVAARF